MGPDGGPRGAPPGRAAPLPTDLFTLGVASGDPTAGRRRALDPARPGAARRRRHARPAGAGAVGGRRRRAVPPGRRRGVARAAPRLGHSVHVEVRGLRAGPRVLLPIPGRRRGLAGRPHPHRAGARRPPGRLRFAFASCQNYPAGLYTAYQHMAEEDVEFVAFLGDYIYESRAEPAPRPHARRHRRAVHAGRLPQPARPVPTDADLQAAHAAAPVDRHARRPRDRQQLGRRDPAGPGRSRPRKRSWPAGSRPSRRTTSTCRCAARRCRAAWTCGCTAARFGELAQCTCWTPASTAATRPASLAEADDPAPHHDGRASRSAGCHAGPQAQRHPVEPFGHRHTASVLAG